MLCANDIPLIKVPSALCKKTISPIKKRHSYPDLLCLFPRFTNCKQFKKSATGKVILFKCFHKVTWRSVERTTKNCGDQQIDTVRSVGTHQILLTLFRYRDWVTKCLFSSGGLFQMLAVISFSLKCCLPHRTLTFQLSLEYTTGNSRLCLRPGLFSTLPIDSPATDVYGDSRSQK